MPFPRLAAASIFLSLAVAAWQPARAAEPAAARADAKDAFERLKSLAGEWRGKAGHGEARDAAVVRWETISNGTAVMEVLFPGTPHEMRSVYHMDGPDLVLTHYCAMGNQPHMKLAAGSSRDELVFEFAGGTNLDPQKDAHVHSGRLRFGGPDELEAEWTVFQGGAKTGANRFVLARAR